MSTHPVTLFTEEEYLRIERAATFKSEFIGGEVFAMPGGTPKHSKLEVNAASDLRVQLRGTRCGVFSSNMRVRTPTSGSHLYPDVSVACGREELNPAPTTSWSTHV
jgi:Uma2 family endonuclease